MWPKIAAPMGRAAKPTAKVTKEAMVAVVASSEGKNSLLKTSAAAVP